MPEVGELSMTVRTPGCSYLHVLLVDVMPEVGELSMTVRTPCSITACAAG
jgi:hypothetical protein